MKGLGRVRRVVGVGVLGVALLAPVAGAPPARALAAGSFANAQWGPLTFCRYAPFPYLVCDLTARIDIGVEPSDYVGAAGSPVLYRARYFFRFPRVTGDIVCSGTSQFFFGVPSQIAGAIPPPVASYAPYAYDEANSASLRNPGFASAPICSGGNLTHVTIDSHDPVVWRPAGPKFTGPYNGVLGTFRTMTAELPRITLGIFSNGNVRVEYTAWPGATQGASLNFGVRA